MRYDKHCESRHKNSGVKDALNAKKQKQNTVSLLTGKPGKQVTFLRGPATVMRIVALSRITGPAGVPKLHRRKQLRAVVRHATMNG